MRPPILLAASAVLVAAAPASAQSFNVDVGAPGSQSPPSNYPAAGLAGVWNSITAEHVTPFTPGSTPDDVFLVDLDGQPTGVGFHQFGGMDLVSANDPSVTDPNAATLLNDYLATHNTVLENCMYLNGLEDGMYELITYAWMPSSPSTLQNVRWDFHPGSDLVGGTWSGQHVEGVTYSREIVEVTGGFLGWHAGIPAGGAEFPGAAFNGFQLRQLGPTSIPAMPIWGLALLGLAMVGLGAATLRRRTALGTPAEETRG